MPKRTLTLSKTTDNNFITKFFRINATQGDDVEIIFNDNDFLNTTKTYSVIVKYGGPKIYLGVDGNPNVNLTPDIIESITTTTSFPSILIPKTFTQNFVANSHHTLQIKVSDADGETIWTTYDFYVAENLFVTTLINPPVSNGVTIVLNSPQNGQVLVYNDVTNTLTNTDLIDYQPAIDEKVSKNGDSMIGEYVIQSSVNPVDTINGTDVFRINAFDTSRLFRIVETKGGHGWMDLANNTGTTQFLIRTEGGTSYLSAGNFILGSNSAGGTNIERKANVISTNAVGALLIKQNANTDPSPTTGGAVLIDNSGNTGAGVNIFTNIGNALGRLLNVFSDNPLFNQALAHFEYKGTANAVEIVNNGTGTGNQAFNIQSNNTQDSAVGIWGREALPRGTVKIIHFKPAGISDAGASALSLRMNCENGETVTGAHGIFIDTESCVTTGKYLIFRSQGTDVFTVEADGTVDIKNQTIKLGSEIADTLLYLDTTKKIRSLSTASYPNISELAFVKGVTSNIQNQLNTNASNITTNTTSINSNTTSIATNTASIAVNASSITANTTSINTINTQINPLLNGWSPSDYGWKSWAYDLSLMSNQSTLTAGTLYFSRLKLATATTISSISLHISIAGTVLSNCYVALYQNNTLLTQSTDQSTSWQTAGNKSISITPQNCQAGFVDIVFWVGGFTTSPSFGRGSSATNINAGLTGQNIRYGSADTGITTTAPATLGTKNTSGAITYWSAIG